MVVDRVHEQVHGHASTHAPAPLPSVHANNHAEYPSPSQHIRLPIPMNLGMVSDVFIKTNTPANARPNPPSGGEEGQGT